MGTSKSGWAKSVTDKLNAVAKRYSAFDDLPQVFLLAEDADDDSQQPSPDQILVVPAGYDDTMRGQVETFDRDASAILALAKARKIVLPGALVELLGSLDDAGVEEKNFFWSHVVDVLLYHFFPLVTKPVRLDVMGAVSKVLARSNVEVSVMAHSLGTSAAHDALSWLANGVIPNFTNLRPPGTRLRHLFMVANVSRVLEQSLEGDPDVFDSPVCPRSVRGDDAYFDEYFNFKHMLDPFTVPKRFEPHWAGSDFHAIERLLHVGDFNTHAWDHYLDNPEVHIPILNALEGFKVISDEVAHSAVENYKVAPVPLCKPGLDFWTVATQKINSSLEADPSVPNLIALGAKYFATAEIAKRMCASDVAPALAVATSPVAKAAANAAAKAVAKAAAKRNG
jgi:hypothetical protein